MEEAQKKQLRKALVSFLNQRQRGYQFLYNHSHNPDCLIALQKIASIRGAWDMISKMDYWRHCREMALQEELIRSVLPSSGGNHAKIRFKMMELLSECRMVQALPHQIYLQKASAQR